LERVKNERLHDLERDSRIRKEGDIYKPVLGKGINLEKIIKNS
jgi:hypothetical protein